MAGVIGIIGGIGSAVSAGSAISNLVGGGTSNSGGTPQTATGGQSANILPPGALSNAGYQYLNDASALQGYGTGYASSFFPQVEQATQTAANNPYATQALQGAQNASAYGTNVLAPMQQQGASALSGLAGQISPYATQAFSQAFSPQIQSYENQALATGFAPNNGLYNQQLQQTVDQSSAINAMNGLAGSPYGVGLTDQATQNFNNAFNLNQANLQGAAANTYGTLANSQIGLAGLGSTISNDVSNLYSGANTLGQGAFNTIGTAGALPANSYQTSANSALSAYGTGAQNANASLNPYTTYLNSLGNIIGLGQVGQQNAASQAATGFNQQQTVGQNLGTALSSLSGTSGGNSSLQSLWNLINGNSSSGTLDGSSYFSNSDQSPTDDIYSD